MVQEDSERFWSRHAINIPINFYRNLFPERSVTNRSVDLVDRWGKSEAIWR